MAIRDRARWCFRLIWNSTSNIITTSFSDELDEVRSQLVDSTRAARFPPPGRSPIPMLSAASECDPGCRCEHEIAVLGDRVWLGQGCGRERFARELSRRFSAPRKAGISVSSLILRNVEELSEVDFLVSSA